MSIDLWLGDSAKMLDEIPDGSIDGVVTDPPFGIGFKYNTHKDTPKGYAEWLWPIIEKAEQKCKPGSPIFVWQAAKNVRHFAEWFPREWRLFIATKNFVQIFKTHMQWSYDPVIVWWTPGEQPYFKKGASRDYFACNTVPSAKKSSYERVKDHPCPRPLDVTIHVIDTWIRPGGVVLDPFMGSGTTAVACRLTGRSFIGIEIDELYLNIAKRRIQEVEATLLV